MIIIIIDSVNMILTLHGPHLNDTMIIYNDNDDDI